MKTIAVQRDPRFSPHSVDKDLAILEAVATPLGAKIIAESQLTANDIAEADIVLNMGRLPQTLDLLAKQGKDKCVINSAKGVRNCQRSLLAQLMAQENIPTPPQKGENGYWIKRGDEAAQTHEDVQFCANETELNAAKARFSQRGITNIVVQAHIVGDLVKFYGVNTANFFRIFYPNDDGTSKFGDEMRNGTPHHYAFATDNLQQAAERLAILTDTMVYGGDAIITKEGLFYIIDFNDWPSFSRCKDEAAKAIRESL
ncbi:hypothetical protein [Prevotella disiens]|jgi:hypothetical protein|uniref:hypothetical protein n=1 Tax=Prevotella disiens TaxID=28130 RepID=UPI00288B8299|nr:hypothetical protein [Prevotella disiens]